MRRTFLTLFLLTLGGFFGEAKAKMTYNEGFAVAMEEHCQDKGYLRPENPYRYRCNQVNRILGIPYRVSLEKCEPENTEEVFLKKPIALVETLNLGNGKIFHRVKLPRKEEKELPACAESLIEEEHSVFQIRQPSLQEKLMYKALHQNGITIVDSETVDIRQLGKPDPITGQIENPNSQDSTYMEFSTPYCQDGEILDSVGHYYRDLGDYLRGGGEGSGSGRFAPNARGGGEGSGSGKIAVTLSIPKSQFGGLRLKENWLERFLGMKPSFYKYIVEGKKIPKRLIRVKCQNAND